jgi:lysine N6-hydroxylase
MPIDKNKKIVIIGGGQSSAEIVSHLISDNSKLPKKITWITRRDNFLPLDDSPFVNELFTPSYSNYFYNMPISKRNELIKKQKLFSDGISNSTLEDIYKRLYEIYYLNGNENICDLVTNSEVINAHKNQESWRIEAKNFCKNITMYFDSDIVILCTGYQYKLPSFLHNLSDEFQRDTDGNLVINEDYSLRWKNSTEYQIYIQNGARHIRGIADPNLSLTPWRSALILNSIAKKKIYDVDNYKSFFDWKD